MILECALTYVNKPTSMMWCRVFTLEVSAVRWEQSAMGIGRDVSDAAPPHVDGDNTQQRWHSYWLTVRHNSAPHNTYCHWHWHCTQCDCVCVCRERCVRQWCCILSPAISRYSPHRQWIVALCQTTRWAATKRWNAKRLEPFPGRYLVFLIDGTNFRKISPPPPKRFKNMKVKFVLFNDAKLELPKSSLPLNNLELALPQSHLTN